MIMKKLLLLFPLLLSCLWGIAADEFRVAELRCEYRDNPLAINTLTPQFSWQTLSVGRGFLQAGYQIQVASDPADLARGRKLLWDEQRKSDVSLHVRYAGRTLKPGQRYYWRVRVSDAAGNYSPWSEIRSFAVGLLDGSDWDGARWIAFEELPDSLRVVPGQEFNKIKIGDRKTALNRLPQFRREVKVTKPVERATVYVSGLGQFELFLNGAKVGRQFPRPCVERLRQAGVLPDVRHQRRIAAGRQRVRCDARQRPLQCAARTLFQGAHQLRLSQDGLQGRDRVCRRDARDYCQRSRLACDRKPRDVQQHLRRRGLRCDARADRMDAARLRRFGLGRAAGDDPAREAGFPRRRTRAGDGGSSPWSRSARPATANGCTTWARTSRGRCSWKSAANAGRQSVQLNTTELFNFECDSITECGGYRGEYRLTYTLRGDEVETWRPQFTYFGQRYVLVSNAVPAGQGTPEGLPEQSLPLVACIRATPPGWPGRSTVRTTCSTRPRSLLRGVSRAIW